MWSRWIKECLRELHERNCLKRKGDSTHPAKGDVVIIKSDDKNHAQWKLGVVIDLITGRDGVVRGAKLRTPKSVIERPVQHFYPLELTCDIAVETAPAALNPIVQALDHKETLQLLPELVSRNLHKWMMKTRDCFYLSCIVIFHFSIAN